MRLSGISPGNIKVPGGLEEAFVYGPYYTSWGGVHKAKGDAIRGLHMDLPSLGERMGERGSDG